MNRGARRAAIFGEPWVCRLFLQVLSELPKRFGIRILAYAIMPNHYHLLLECPEGNLAKAMKHLGAEFTQRLNRAMAWDGPVFRGRYKNRVVTTDAYLAHLFAYIHLNPVRDGFAVSADAARWTSHRALVGLERAPEWLDRGRLTAAHGSLEAYGKYLEELLADRVVLPDAWRPERLWVPEPEKAPLCAPRAPLSRDAERVLAEVADVTGVSTAGLRTRAPGRGGNAPRLLAGWWLTQRTRLSNVEIGRVLGCTGSRVSQMRALVERQPGRLRDLRERLEAPSPDAGTPLLCEPPAATYGSAQATQRGDRAAQTYVASPPPPGSRAPRPRGSGQIPEWTATTSAVEADPVARTVTYFAPKARAIPVVDGRWPATRP